MDKEPPSFRTLTSVLGSLIDLVVPTIESMCQPEAHGRGRCVLASMVSMDVLHALGFPDAYVLPCTVQVVNAGAQEYLRQCQGLPLEKQQRLVEIYKTTHDAHIVVIGADDSPDRDNGWSGHLVVVVGGYLLDLTLDQASRPHKGIHLEPMVVPLCVPDARTAENGIRVAGAQETKTRTLVEWYTTPLNQRYLQAPDAAPEKRKVFAVPILESIRHAMVEMPC